MVKRIVKMTFRSGEADAFLSIFEQYREQIAAASGCLSLEMLRDANNPEVFFTYSTWENPEALDAYRQSEIFGIVWPQTKSLFAFPAEAWTVYSQWKSAEN